MVAYAKLCRAQTLPCPAGERCPGYQRLLEDASAATARGDWDAFARAQAELTAHLAPIEPARAQLEAAVLALPSTLLANVCAVTERNVSGVEELGEDFLLAERSLFDCPVHRTLHFYNAPEAKRLTANTLSSLHTTLQQAVKAGQLTAISAAPLQKAAGVAQHEFSTLRKAGHDGLLASRVAAYEQPGNQAWLLEAELCRRLQRAGLDPDVNYARLQQQKRADPSRVGLPYLPAEQVPQALLIEFHRCYRKHKHASLAAAQKALTAAKQRAGEAPASAYSCVTCGQYHWGHTPKRIDAPNRANLRASWNKFPALADRFTLERKLVTFA